MNEEVKNLSNSQGQPLIDVRDGVKADLSFILATWLRGLRFGNSWFLMIESDTYFNTYHRVVETILYRATTQIKVACLKDDPEVILGYAIYDSNALHWVFVKKAWRKIGVAGRLVPSDAKTVTHLTEVGKSIIKKKGLAFNPFLI